MHVTIELPDSLAERVTEESGRLSELMVRALRPKPQQMSALRREVLSFLARGPEASEIASFQPSEAAAQRMSDLLQRAKEGHLTPTEEAEMDEIEEIDHLVSLLKAEARKHVRTAA